MALTLKAISYKGVPTAHEISAQFDEVGGSIGRAPDNHLVLPDPEKFVSRLHARIVYEGGQYFIQDSSTGGTYLSRTDMLLQQNRAPLQNGEVLRIGEYELRATIEDYAAAGYSPKVEPVVRQLEMAESNLLDDPFSTQEKVADKSDLFGSFIEQPESSVFHQSFTPPQISNPPPETSVDDLEFGDLLSSLNSLPGTGNSHNPPQLPPLPDDFFAEEDSALPDIKPPDPVPGFDLDVDDSAPEPEHLSGLSGEPTATFAEPPITSAPPAPDDFIVPSPRAKPYVAPAQTPPPQAATAAADSELVREFLAGAGIVDAHFLPAEQWPLLMRTSGELLRSMVEGLMQVLRARAELKSQFRVSVTTMRSINNNPLKFTPNTDDAIRLILSPTNPGFLSPKEAVREGFGDIMNHQMAMTAGIQAALAEILGSFDPERIEKSQAEGVLFQKKAKCWEHYLEKYPQLKAVAQEEFFGDAFADAYEKQMLLLSRSSKKQ